MHSRYNIEIYKCIAFTECRRCWVTSFVLIGIVLFYIQINSLLEMFFNIGYSHWFCVPPTPESREHKKVVP